MRTIAMAATVLLLTGSSAAAQTAAVEVGGGVSFAGLRHSADDWGDGLESTGVQAQAELPLSPRFDFEGSMTYGRRAMPRPSFPGAMVEGGEPNRSEGLFVLALNQRLLRTSSPGFHGFVSYGLAWISGTTSRSAVRVSYPNGYVFSDAAYSHSRTAGGFLVFGGGFERGVASRVAVRADVGVLTAFLVAPVGVRASVTAMIRMGRH
ncbi:MAG TPA: hypothetical protein VJN96_08715 [Vicinamibacterales bacterium]|nr:hypothetical protein [Vicinamibacterales bacterium]